MQRREFITLVGGAAAWPLTARAQQESKIWRIGFLTPRSRPSPPDRDMFSDAFMQGMSDLGYSEGKNLAVEWRYADGDYKSLAGFATELAGMNLPVIVTYGTAAARVLQGTTKTIPIVVAAAVDLVGAGIVASLARPGGNVTGLTVIAVDLSPKHLELLRAISPRLSRVAVLVNAGNAADAAVVKNVQAAAQPANIAVLPVEARTADEIAHAFATSARERAGAVIVAADAFFSGQGALIAQLCAKHRLPTIGIYREHVIAGALMSYGQNIAQFHRQAATFVDKILKGAKPADLPVEQPTKIQLVINRKAAHTLGLTVPPDLLVRADEVIG